MQEDTQAGMIYAYLEDYTGDRVCSKQLYEEALGNSNPPAEWETRAICEIMNTGIANGSIQGWTAYKSPKRYKKYGSQKGWERVNQAPPEGTVFRKSRKKKPGKWNCHSENPPVNSLVDALVDSRLTGKSLIFGALLPFVKPCQPRNQRKSKK